MPAFTGSRRRVAPEPEPVEAAPEREQHEWLWPIETRDGWEEVTTSELRRRAQAKVTEILDRQARYLRQAPLVAVAVPSGAELQLPEELKVRAECLLSFHGSGRRVVVVHLSSAAVLNERGESGELPTPAQQLELLERFVRRALPCQKPGGELDGPGAWPIYGPRVCQALSAMEELMVVGMADGTETLPLWKRVLAWLRIHIPTGGGQFLQIIQQQAGPCVAFDFAWNQFFTQQLWILAAASLISLCIGAAPADSGVWSPTWEFCKLALVGWGIFVAVRGQYPTGRLDKEPPFPCGSMAKSSDCDAWGVGFRSWMRLLAIGAPVISAFTIVVYLTVLGVTQLIVFMVFVWGECAHRGCVGPDDKHGFLGTFAEMLVDIAMAIIFELYFALAKSLSERLAALRHRRNTDEFNLSVEMLLIVLAAVERISTFGALAFVFVPQWEKPPPEDIIDMRRPCNDLVLGTGSLFCLQRRLPASVRRSVFRKMLNGPFLVAPFVNILVKVILPVVARQLDSFARSSGEDCWEPCKAPTHLVARTLALLLSYDGDSVGCLRFIVRGWPFSEVSAVRGPDGKLVHTEPSPPWEELRGVARAAASAAKTRASGALGRLSALASRAAPGGSRSECDDTPETLQLDLACEEMEPKDLIHRALQEAVRKPFEPASELLEVQMSFLWILLFAPIVPHGILPTLLAQVIENKTDLAKMLLARRRPFPESALIVHKTQQAFVRAAAFGATGWSLGLSLMTYNNDLWRWSWAARACTAACVTAWLFIAAGIALAHSDRAWLGVIGAVSVALLAAFVVSSGLVDSS